MMMLFRPANCARRLMLARCSSCKWWLRSTGGALSAQHSSDVSGGLVHISTAKMGGIYRMAELTDERPAMPEISATGQGQ